MLDRFGGTLNAFVPFTNTYNTIEFPYATSFLIIPSIGHIGVKGQCGGFCG